MTACHPYSPCFPCSYSHTRSLHFDTLAEKPLLDALVTTLRRMEGAGVGTVTYSIHWWAGFWVLWGGAQWVASSPMESCDS